MLTLGLLSDPEPGEPVPVLLPLASWDPRNEHLYTWLARKLTEEYPGLGNAAAYGPHAAQRLVADERVMPVLDGLDETPPELQAAVIDAIDLATAGGRPLVVTCRSAEYEAAVLREGVTLAVSTVVEMQPVGIESAARFLTARQPPGYSGWQPVVEHLRRHPRGPLAQVLSIPLMLDLARTAYSGRGGDPAELTDTERFPDQASLEEHLLDQFLPAAYPLQVPRLSSAAGIRSAAPPHYEPEHARRWLTLLAQHLHSARTPDLAWWRLEEAISQPARGLISAFPSALLFAVAGEIAGGYRYRDRVRGRLCHGRLRSQRPGKTTWPASRRTKISRNGRALPAQGGDWSRDRGHAGGRLVPLARLGARAWPGFRASARSAGVA